MGLLMAPSDSKPSYMAAVMSTMIPKEHGSGPSTGSYRGQTMSPGLPQAMYGRMALLGDRYKSMVDPNKTNLVSPLSTYMTSTAGNNYTH
jgi:hypothetical protein